MTIGIVLLIGSVFSFILLMTYILPKLFLKVSYTVSEPVDIGIKRCFYKGKRCVVYEGGSEIRKYIKKYLLLQGKGHKILRCKMTHPIGYIDYDIVVFDRYDKVHSVINVKESLVNSEYTRRVELPDEASYVRLVIRKVNDTVITKEPIAFIPRARINWYMIFAILVTALETFVLKVSCAYAFGGVFRESFVRSSKGLVVSLLFAIVTGIIALVTVKSSIKRHSTR